MDQLYLIDLHNSTLASSAIKGIEEIPAGYGTSIPLRSCFGVSVPSDVLLSSAPQNLGDLVTKKYAGMLAAYPEYQYVLYDEQIDEVGWATRDKATTGGRQSTSLGPFGSLTSSAATLSATPTHCVVRWELYRYITTPNDPYDTTQRGYVRVDPASVTVSVSFNGGSDYNAVSNDTLFSIPLAEQGTSFIIVISSVITTKLYLGSWALLY